jgi:hypothetical protein
MVTDYATIVSTVCKVPPLCLDQKHVKEYQSRSVTSKGEPINTVNGQPPTRFHKGLTARLIIYEIKR